MSHVRASFRPETREINIKVQSSTIVDTVFRNKIKVILGVR